MTDFLFSRPSFIDGVISIVDLIGISPDYNSSTTPEEADRRARQADIKALKKDFETAYCKVKAQYV